MEKNMQNPNYSINTKNRADGIALLRSISSSAAKAAFFDPQYRGVLDKLSYGNEGQGRGKLDAICLRCLKM